MPVQSKYIAKIPDTDGIIYYDDEDDAIWKDLYDRQIPYIEKYCADEYIGGLKKLSLSADRVPQCEEISIVLRDLTGWQVAPVPALIGFGEFFKMLSERTFPAASFIRNRQDFDYVEEPDIFHELFGHTPLLTDSRFADFTQSIGRAGLKASATEYSWLIRLYWFTIEFGLKKQDGGLKALGAGLASSPTELLYCLDSVEAERREFDVLDILRTPYRIDIHQPVYFVLDTLDDLFELANRDLLSDVHQAQKMGLFAPKYPSKKVI